MILHHFGVYLSQTNLYQIYLCFKRQSLYKLQQNKLGLNCQINSFIDVANGCRKLISKNFVENFSFNFVYTCHCIQRIFYILASLFFKCIKIIHLNSETSKFNIYYNTWKKRNNHNSRYPANKSFKLHQLQKLYYVKVFIKKNSIM